MAQTCQLAVQRINFYSSDEGMAYKDESRYLSVDPAPAFPSSRPLSELRMCLLDETAEIFHRYRAMFALRNLGGREAIEALGLSFHSKSALLKHEVAYVLGQMQDKSAVDTLRYLFAIEHLKAPQLLHFAPVNSLCFCASAIRSTSCHILEQSLSQWLMDMVQKTMDVTVTTQGKVGLRLLFTRTTHGWTRFALHAGGC